MEKLVRLVDFLLDFVDEMDLFVQVLLHFFEAHEELLRPFPPQLRVSPITQVHLLQILNTVFVLVQQAIAHILHVQVQRSFL